ncbi:hypothetical protein GW17_00007134 [Ensete ventricosum]|nr:hypothetical protein GW17_00007134 [Ensete ventricosum]
MSCPLPDEVLAKIISYLSAKAFFKLLHVCKSFYQLSSDSHFLVSQSYHNKAISGFFINNYNIFKSFIPIDPCASVPNTSIEFLRKSEAMILGSTGGLIFVVHKEDRWFDAIASRLWIYNGLWVYNPARRTRCQLPSPPGKCVRGGIAVRFMSTRDAMMTDYKLVYLAHRPTWSLLHHCRVYDSVARAWTMDKELDFGGRELDLEHPVVYGDTVFWASSDSYVVAFDVREECTQIIPMPKDVIINDFNTIGLAKWEGKSLCLIHYNMIHCGFVLWLVKETSGSASGWVKAQEISLFELGLRELCFVNFVVLSEMASTMLLTFTTYEGVYSYNINDGELKKLALLEFYRTPTFFPYSNTLQTCGEQEELF